MLTNDPIIINCRRSYCEAEMQGIMGENNSGNSIEITEGLSEEVTFQLELEGRRGVCWPKYGKKEGSRCGKLCVKALRSSVFVSFCYKKWKKPV